MNSPYYKITENFDNILITTHANPDGDAIGSALGMYHFLKKFSKQVHVIVPNDYPSYYYWMPGNEVILNFEQNRKTCKQIIQKSDLIYCLDYNALHRLGEMESIVRESSAVKFLIDHHPQPKTSDFDYHLSTTETSSTAELVIDFMEQAGYLQLLDKKIASCIYVGIMTDTGSFSYTCNYSKTYLTVAKLIDTGIDAEDIHRKIYDTFTENRMRLLGHSLSNKLVVIPEYHTAYISLSKEELNIFKFRTGDTEGLVNYALAIEDIKFAAFFTEKSKKIRISFRSKGDFSVNDFVRQHFEGGGHKNAAGGNAYKSLAETIKIFESLLPQYKNELSKA